MKAFHSADIRNFAVVGHGGSGKTMLCEAMLACSGAIERMGSIEAASTVSDYHEDEKERKISIHASVLHTTWQGKKLNIIDTPGYLDFISESLGALRVGDFALVVVDGVHGVEVGTDQVWDFAERYEVPKMIVVNGADKEGVDFDSVLAQCREHFGNNVFPLTIPLNPGDGFDRLLDVMRSEVITYKHDGSGEFSELKAEGDDRARVKALHRELIEYVAESNEALMEKFFEQDGLSEDEMRDGLHAAIQNGTFIPLFCTSATTDVGVARLLDFIAKYGSSPVDRKTVKAEDLDGNEVRVSLDDPETVLYVFKTVSESHVGEMSYFRVYSGSVKTGMELYNSARNLTERVGQISTLNGKNRESVDELFDGDIGAVVKLKDTHTDNTLCSPGKKVRLPEVEYPKPNIHGALHLLNKGDEDRIAQGLATLHEEDPTFIYGANAERKQTIISGQGELHLKTIVDALKRRFNVEIELIEPRVPFRETIHAKAESKYRHKKQSGGAGQFAEVWMRIEPNERNAGVEFKESLVGQNVDRVFVPSVEKGVNAALTEGVYAGYHIVDVKIDFYDGKTHPVDSKDVAFQIAGKHAFQEAFLAAKPCLLEPLYNVSVKAPQDCIGDVMGDISSRRGRILGMDNDGNFQIVNALMPEAELYRYSSTLRALTRGRGIHTEEFSHYEEMPRDMAQKVIAAAKAKEEH